MVDVSSNVSVEGMRAAINNPTRTVAVTIMQTETFTIYVDVPEKATRSEVNAIAEQVSKVDDVLGLAYPNSDCSTHIYKIEEAKPANGTFVYNVDADGLDERRVGC